MSRRNLAQSSAPLVGYSSLRFDQRDFGVHLLKNRPHEWLRVRTLYQRGMKLGAFLLLQKLKESLDPSNREGKSPFSVWAKVARLVASSLLLIGVSTNIRSMYAKERIKYL